MSVWRQSDRDRDRERQRQRQRCQTGLRIYCGKGRGGCMLMKPSRFKLAQTHRNAECEVLVFSPNPATMSLSTDLCKLHR